MKVFLGGTCGNSKWRDKFIPELEKNGIDYFNPVVKDWNEEARKKEEEVKKECDYLLFVVTPLHKGFYSFLELGVVLYEHPNKLIFCISHTDKTVHWFDIVNIKFKDHILNSLRDIKEFLDKKGCPCFEDLQDVTNFLIKKKKEK
jgi:hypothetical protein